MNTTRLGYVKMLGANYFPYGSSSFVFEINKDSLLISLSVVKKIHLFWLSLTFLENVNQEYQNGNSLEKMLGLGRVKLESIKDVEIDFFDVFYSIGIIGILFYAIS